MENISRGPTLLLFCYYFGDFVIILTEPSMQDVTQLQDSPPSFKCNVQRESLSVDSQNIPCPTLERRVIFVFIYRRPTLYPLEIAVDFLKSL